MTVKESAALARKSAWALAALNEQTRSRALNLIADALNDSRVTLIRANQEDLTAAQEDNLSAPLLSRLKLDDKKLDGLVDGLRQLSAMPPVLERTTLARELSPGLNLYRVTCPIGVLGIVFESRPDALVQIASLALKSGNAVLLKGGREALHTNQALFDVIERASVLAGLPDGWAHLLKTREDVNSMLSLDEDIDLLVPRGGKAFVRWIMDHTHIPVMGHADGLCHVYVDESADLAQALRVTVDAKTQAYAVCNAAETLLVHRAIAPSFLPVLFAALTEKGVQVRGDERTRALIACEEASDEDWSTEYLDAILSIRVVDSLSEAVAHINRYGSHHTDAILTKDDENARLFAALVDSADVFVNCSTRFADGFRFGFGAEVGIATGKLHARGPVGPEGLCTYKYVLCGSGQTVADTMDGTISYTHRDLDTPCPFFPG